MSLSNKEQQFNTIVIGGGQAGLAVGYYLAKQGREFVILDAQDRIGASWRSRWESLRLFTPARYSSLPGMPFPLPPRTYPSKEEMADYLEAYAHHFALPIHLQTPVETLTREGEQYLLTSGERRFRASNMVVAMGALQQPKIPEFASSLDAGIRQLHSQQYRSPEQLQAGAVLIVGAGNSGAEIALDLVKGHAVWLAGPEVSHVPVGLGNPLLWWIFSQVLTLHTPLGRAAIQSSLKHPGASPLFRLDSGMLEEASVKRVPRVTGVQQGKPQLADGQRLDIANVIWCTGYTADFRWIQIPVFGTDGYPLHARGVVKGEPGLYFVGLPFQFAFTSSLIGGVGRDARYIAEQIALRSPAHAEHIEPPATREAVTVKPGEGISS